MHPEYLKHLEKGFGKEPTSTTDIIIQCGPVQTEYHAHKDILSTYPELVKKRDDNGLIRLPQERPETVLALLDSAYKGDWTESHSLQTGLTDEKLAQEGLQLYVLAHGLNIGSLMFNIAEVVGTSVEKCIGPVGQVARVPEWLPHFIAAVYTATPPEDRELRDQVISCFKRSDRARQLIRHEVFLRATEGIPGLLLELFRVNLGLGPIHDRPVGDGEKSPSQPAARKSAPSTCGNAARKSAPSTLAIRDGLN